MLDLFSHYAIYHSPIRAFVVNSLSQLSLLLSISLRTSLRRQLQCPGGILFRNIQFHKLKVIRSIELLILEQVMHLGFCLDLESLMLAFFRPEDFDEVFEMPGLDVVVCCVHAMDEAFDCEAVVADYETRDFISDWVKQRRGRGVTNIIGFNPRRIIVLSSWAVSWKDPSPTKRTVLRCSPASRVASAAP
jgi:hypothetical protein